MITHTEKPIGVKEAADMLNISPKTLYNKVSRGEIPYYKPSGMLLFYASELTDYIRASRVKTRAEIAADASSRS